MTTKHTPGPWRVVDREVMEDGSVYPCHILGGVADYQVCTLESPEIAKHGAEQPHLFPGLNGILGPNARLIAAAPDYHDAAGWILAAVATNAAPVNPFAALEEMALDGKHVTLDAGLVLDLLKAHAKAKGEQQ